MSSVAGDVRQETDEISALPFADLRWVRAVARRIGWANAYCLGVDLLTRAAVLFGAAAAYVFGPTVTWHGMITRLDAYWYQHIARVGYGHGLHPAGVPPFHARFSSWAFYPGYPLAIRLMQEITRLPYAPAAVLASELAYGQPS